jgi:hypothetical protein
VKKLPPENHLFAGVRPIVRKTQKKKKKKKKKKRKFKIEFFSFSSKL